MSTFIHALKQFGVFCLDAFFPLDQSCMACGKIEWVKPPFLCQDCLKNLIRPTFPCPACGKSRFHEDHMCSHCNPSAFTYTKRILGFELNEATKDMVHKHKYEHHRYLAHAFAHMLIMRLEEEGVRFTAVASIPSGKKRVQMRGCDHCADIAIEVAKHFGVPYIKPLVRVQHELTQAGLNRMQRMSNMIGAFARVGELGSEVNLLLIDDVLTTGATLEQAGMLLKEDVGELYAAAVFYAVEELD